jgi:hypothetical protein
MWLKKTLSDGFEYFQYYDTPDENVLFPSVFNKTHMAPVHSNDLYDGEKSSEYIECRVEVFENFMISGFAGLLAVYAKEIGFFDLFGTYMNVEMKEVEFTIQNKIEVIIIATCMGCKHTKDINYELRPYPALPQILGMDRIPEQSQINRVYHKLNIYNYDELLHIMQLQLNNYCFPLITEPTIDIDIDTTGIIAYGETYELRRKGYFSKQKGKKGYQLTAAITSGSLNFAVANSFDPGNIKPGSRFFDVLYETAEALGSMDRIGIIRADRAHGIGANIEELIGLKKEFLIKGLKGETANNYIKKIGLGNIIWSEVSDIVRVSDIGYQTVPRCSHKVRTILIETLFCEGKRKKVKRKYSCLYAQIKKSMNEVEIFELYGQRQIIESVFDTEKNGLAIDVLKCRNFIGLSASCLLTLISYNLLCVFRKNVLSKLQLDHLGIKEIVKRLMNIPARIEQKDNGVSFVFPKNHPYTKNMADSKNWTNLVHKISCKS